jgi:putative flippase GtrA
MSRRFTAYKMPLSLDRTNLKSPHIRKFAKFVSAGISGGVVSELILLIGLLTIYRKLSIPSATYSLSTLLGLNILAQGAGIAVAFFINEKITVNVQNDQKNKGKKQLTMRLLKFGGINAVGSAINILIQLLLLVTLSLSPALGNIVGGVIGSAVAYAIIYRASMQFVWKPSTSKEVTGTVKF